jgi:hypothetical protein
MINESYNFSGLSDDKKEHVYNVFKDSYEKTTGTSWSKDKFYSRAQGWLFFGDDNGFVTVRPQQSGLYKLVGVAGNTKSILTGLSELKSQNEPVWGMVSADIQSMAVKQGFKTPPTFLLKVLLKFIPSSVFGGADFEINSDGSLTLKYDDVGDAKKYFIGNEQYFKKLKSDILPSLKDKLTTLPLVVRKGIDMFLNEEENKIDETIINEELNRIKKIIKNL